MSYKRRMERGSYYLQSPFGYRLVEERIGDHPGRSRAGTMDIRILSFRKSLEWIAEQMEKAGIPTPDNAPYWQKTSILYPDQREVHR